MVTDVQIERRCRYRLDKHGMKLHKEKNEYGQPVYYITSWEYPDRPDDDDTRSWLSLDQVLNYCEELKEDKQ